MRAGEGNKLEGTGPEYRMQEEQYASSATLCVVQDECI